MTSYYLNSHPKNGIAKTVSQKRYPKRTSVAPSYLICRMSSHQYTRFGTIRGLVLILLNVGKKKVSFTIRTFLNRTIVNHSSMRDPFRGA